MKKLLPAAVISLLLFASCKKSSEELVTPAISDYAPLTVGKYITYSLDSLVYTNFGTVEAHRFYDVRYVVADTASDNLGNKGYKIIRYIKPSGSGTFTPDNTFSGYNTGRNFEFIENNLRYIKLAQPVKEGGSWKGNSYINTSSGGTPGLDYLDDWDYTYENVGQSAKVGSVTLANTVTVNQRDLSDGLPVTGATNYAQRDFSKEIYAAGIGLVYREFLHFEYQGGSHTYEGYGVKYTMTDHN